ncbi:MAG: 2,3-bisphosphoglycerate-independent phosphoglycerate mutase [Phycisphaerae bacterium]|nr:2,3-bisphosphoglycerate-independent phosphoglycerate mutase [Phycisphaerae bacterium]
MLTLSTARACHPTATGGPHTAHTTYPVECVVVGKGLERPDAPGPDAPPSGGPGLREGGRLADIAPTLLELMGVEKPGGMAGESLFHERPGTA